MKPPSPLTSPSLETGRAASLLPPGHELVEGICELEAPLRLHFGGELACVELAFRLSGAVAPLSSPCWAAFPPAATSMPRRPAKLGWWDDMVGPGRPLDTDRYRVLGMDFLGGSHRTTGPVRGTDIPERQRLRPGRLSRRTHAATSASSSLRGCVGASYGGMVTLALAERHRARVGTPS